MYAKKKSTLDHFKSIDGSHRTKKVVIAETTSDNDTMNNQSKISIGLVDSARHMELPQDIFTAEALASRNTELANKKSSHGG